MSDTGRTDSSSADSVLGDTVLIVAAEASSSLYAQRLLETWRASGTPVRAFGIGSDAMESLGFERLGRSEDLAVVGLQEVLAHFSDIWKVFHRLVDEAAVRKPKFALLLDYPDFNFRLAKRLKDLDIPVVYYISPQLWAWRKGRIKLVRKYIDRMLVLFPFEKGFYEKHGVQVDFVGHPALDEIADSLFDEKKLRERRQRFNLGPQDLVLALMPGSRRSEIKHHLQTQLEAARLVLAEAPHVKVALFVAPSLDRDELRARLGDVGFPIQLVQEPPMEMISLADVVLVASGTATLMVGMLEKPMVIMYRMNPISAFLAKRLVKETPFFGMVNLIMGREVVPERFQEAANPTKLAEELLQLIRDPSRRARVREDLKTMRERLGARGATEKVATILSRYFRPEPEPRS
ncbi:MAG: lipid-A-disaccharide synthase [Bdellovibrionaceae bacterium]|nr:lipid-A-disaccharide synthase [Pseudobdellovibrionaceae bacterium]